MTQQEFEIRTGKKVTPSEFEDINRIYLNLPLMTKDRFCKYWKKVEFNPIVIELSDYVDLLIDRIVELKTKDKELKEKILKY